MLKILKRLNLREWAGIAVSVGFIVLQVWLELKIPEYTKTITILVETPGSAVSEIWKQGGFMLACALASLLSAIVVGFFAARVAASFSRRLREGLFNQVESFSMSEINRFSTASLITRSTNDITQIQMFIAMGMQMIIKAPIMAVWAVVKILGKDWEWSVATAIAVVVLVLMIAVIVAAVMPRFKKIQTMTDNLNRVTRENLSGLRVVKAYNAEKFQEGKFAAANDDLTATNLYVHRTMAFLNPGMNLIMNGLSLAIYIIGATLVSNAALLARKDLFGDMIQFSSYAMQVVLSFMMLTMIFVMLPRASVSAKRIAEVLDTESGIKDGKGAQPLARGEVEFRNVSFKYDDSEEYVLKDISFKANKGETVAFIGSTGSGKSTLVNLVPRFYDATEGEVLVDGVNVRDYKLHDLHNLLGYVPQKGVLFAGSVESNVAYGEGASEITAEKVGEALEVAKAAEFVEKMQGGVQAPISQGGANVSGGQKQRLSIARAVARDPEIFIFDDSFSALDYKTDRDLRSALKEYTADATNLIVAQRIGTIKHADKILVLDEGKTAGIGTHEELMKNCEVYREIALSQLSEEELK